MMRPVSMFRIAAILSLLFAIGHTAGFLSFRPMSAEGQMILRAMATPLSEDGTSFSYAGFYRGFGLYGGMALLLTALWAWWLGTLSRQVPEATIFSGVALALFQLGGFVLALRYFPLPSVILSGTLVIVLTLAIVGAARRKAS